MFEVLGYREVDYTSKVSNKRVKGREFYLVGDAGDDTVGRRCLTMFFREGAYDPSAQPGKIVEVEYDLDRSMKPYPKALVAE